jgi:N5-(carboxyethyl)ornithine synthase
MLKIGVVRTSLKENERRVPIYPENLLWIPEEVRKNMWFETGYGEPYYFTDEYFHRFVAGTMPREDILGRTDLVILPKPTERDLQSMSEHSVLFGWGHCVQQVAITQEAINRRITMIAWEDMHAWSPKAERVMHIFYKNNEIAGYAAVLHVLQLLGADGLYGPRRRVAVIGFGSVSRGAIYALHGRGFNNIHVYTRRLIHTVFDQNPDVYYHHIEMDTNGYAQVREPWGEVHPLIDDLAEADFICNGVLQDTDNPMMFVRNNEVGRLKRGSVVIDISCDEGMGFEFSKPTTFDEPSFIIGDNIFYYSVDHTPSYLWNAASREISRAMIPFLPAIALGPDAWEKNETIRRAINILEGCVQNPKILSFQKRNQVFPHAFMPDGR